MIISYTDMSVTTNFAKECDLKYYLGRHIYIRCHNCMFPYKIRDISK
jgi:hypothetical protein